MNSQRKIMLWCVPRSCSTAFTKSISQIENSKIFFEPFHNSYYRGEDRVSKRFQDTPPIPGVKYSQTKMSLENDINGFDLIFCKDMVYFIRPYLDRLDEVLPKGYQHTFLIRHPRKTVSSLYKGIIQGIDPEFDYLDPAQVEFKPLHDLFFKIKQRTGETPVLLDSDDLLENPDLALKTYCEMTGIPFAEKMLRWQLGCVDGLAPCWQETLRHSTGFIKNPSPTGKDDIQLSDEVEQAIEDNMVYYNTLYKYRITF